MNNNQIWYRDNANTDNYVYDYYYNDVSKSLWLKSDSADSVSFDYDPSEAPDSLNINLDDFILLFLLVSFVRLCLVVRHIF